MSEDRDLPDKATETWIETLVQMGLAGFGGAIGLVNPPAGLAIATTSPLAVRAAKRLNRVRSDQITQLIAPLVEARLDPESLLDQLEQAPRLVALVQRAVLASQTATSAWKLRVLGEALCQGLLAGDTAEVDEHERVIDAVQPLEGPDVLILDRLARMRDENPTKGRTSADIVEALPRLEKIVDSCLARLTRQGVVRYVALYDYIGVEVTEFGKAVLTAMKNAGWS